MITRKMLQMTVPFTAKFRRISPLLRRQERNLSSPSIANASALTVLSMTTPVHSRQVDHRHNGFYVPTMIACDRYYSNIDRKGINLKMTESKKRITETIANKRIDLQQRKAVLVQDLRDKKMKVKEKVKEMEEIIQRENIWTIPNWLCVGRGILAPYVGYVIVQGHYQLAIGLLAVAAVTDVMDGFIARNWKSQASKLGSFLDPMADKLLVGSLAISLAYCGLLPMWLLAMIILRDISLIVAGCVIRFISLPPPRTIVRYFDATHVTAKLKPTLTSKLNTVVQLACIGASLGAPMYGYVDHTLLHGLWYFTGFTTAAAALSYILSKDTYKIIKDSKKKTVS